MRVYQFRHIRGPGKCSRRHYRTGSAAPSRTMGRLRRLALVLLGVSASSPCSRAAGGPRRGLPRRAPELVEVVVTLPQPPLVAGDPPRPQPRGARDDAPPAERPRARERLLPADARDRAAHAAGADPDGDPRRARPLALRRRPRTGWPSSSPAPSSRRSRAIPGATVWPSVTYHALAATDKTPAADRRADRLGADARDRGPGDEDRDHRRRRRPDAPVLRPDRLHVPGRLPEGEHRLHDAEGDRRARVRRRRARRGSTRTRRSTRRTPTTRRTSPGSPPATTARSRTRGAARSRSPGSRRRVPRQLQGADRPDGRTSGSTATRPRSPPGSSRP